MEMSAVCPVRTLSRPEWCHTGGWSNWRLFKKLRAIFLAAFRTQALFIDVFLWLYLRLFLLQLVLMR